MIFAPGDLVCKVGTNFRMMVIAQADHVCSSSEAFYDCVWEQGDKLFVESVSASNLVIIRAERRRLPRGGKLDFPRNCATWDAEPSTLELVKGLVPAGGDAIA
jgi:hypothetical protein